VRAYVFLDPDGTQDFALLVVVASPTGVTYAHQCAGLRTEVREQEGFAIPVGGPDAAMPLLTFFRQRFKGNPPSRTFGGASTWTDADVRELEALVGNIPLWRTRPDVEGDSERAFLKLDISNLSDVTEGWIPVQTVYGPAILLFRNSD
jgi:Family of unknown function (DUF6210)